MQRVEAGYRLVLQAMWEHDRPRLLKPVYRAAETHRLESGQLNQDTFSRDAKFKAAYSRIRESVSLMDEHSTASLDDVCSVVGVLGLTLDEITAAVRPRPWNALAGSVVILVCPARGVTGFTTGQGGGSTIAIQEGDFGALIELTRGINALGRPFSYEVETIQTGALDEAQERYDGWKRTRRIAGVISVGSSRVNPLSAVIANDVFSGLEGPPEVRFVWATGAFPGSELDCLSELDANAPSSFVRQSGRSNKGIAANKDTATSRDHDAGILLLSRAEDGFLRGVAAGLGARGTLAAAKGISAIWEVDERMDEDYELLEVVEADPIRSGDAGRLL